LERISGVCPGDTLVFPGDVTNPDHRRAVIEMVLARWGRIDLLVNNAGLGAYGPFTDTSEDLWRRLFEVNLFAPVALTREVLPSMLAAGQGLIINVASLGGLVAHAPRVTAYIASKHALVGFSRGLAKELTGTGVRVKAVCPHLTDTDFFQTGEGSEAMAAEATRFRDYMDQPEAVAEGIMEQLGREGLILFPTEKPARAFAKMRDI
jgi:short-subunit dehydrogenase